MTSRRAFRMAMRRPLWLVRPHPVLLPKIRLKEMQKPRKIGVRIAECIPADIFVSASSVIRDV